MHCVTCGLECALKARYKLQYEGLCRALWFFLATNAQPRRPLFPTVLSQFLAFEDYVQKGCVVLLRCWASPTLDFHYSSPARPTRAEAYCLCYSHLDHFCICRLCSLMTAAKVIFRSVRSWIKCATDKELRLSQELSTRLVNLPQCTSAGECMLHSFES